MIYSYFRHSTYLRRFWLEAVCRLLLKTLPCAKTGVQEEEMSRSRDSALSGHFEVVSFAQNGLSSALQLLQTLHWGSAGHSWVWWHQCEELCVWLTICCGPASFYPDLMISPVLPKG